MAGVDFSILDVRRPVVSVAHGECDESQTQGEQKSRAWMSELELSKVFQQLKIGIEVMIDGKLSQTRAQ